MDPITVFAALKAALALAEELAPVVTELAQKGEITVAQQQEVQAAYASLKSRADGQFLGREWEVTKP